MAKKTTKKRKKKAVKSKKKAVKTKKANPVGRPSTYRKKFCNINGYLRDCEKRLKLPSIVGYAGYLGVTSNRLHEWGKKHPEFRYSLDILLDIQHELLLSNGLTGTYNASIAKLILSNNHGYKVRQDFTSEDEPLSAPIINMGDG